MSSTLDTSNYEFRCDLCNEIMIFNQNLIQSHYDSMHNGQDTAWRKYTDLNKIASQTATNHKRTHFMQQVTTNQIEKDRELAFVSPETIAKARDFANAVNARLYKFKTLADGYAHKILDLGNGEKSKLDIYMSTDERKRAARTLYDKDINLNHYLFMPGFNFILDADEVKGAIVGLAIIEDAFLNKLFDQGLVEGVSVEYFRRRETCSCTQSCNCEHTGVVFVGLAVITVPFQPADDQSQLVEVLSAELSGPRAERIVSQVQADLKRRITGKRNKNYSYQNSSERTSAAQSDNTGNEDMNQEIEKFIAEQITAIKTQYESKIATMQTEMQSLRADLLYLQDQARKQRDALATGRGLHKNSNEITADEYKQMADARLQAASLEEVVLFDAASKGVNIENKAELDAWLGLDRSRSRK